MFLLVLSLLFPKTDTVVDFQLTVLNFANTDGYLMVAVYNHQDSYMKLPYRSRKVAVNDSESLNLTFENMPVGEYAITVFHDENGNGVLDSNFFGIPQEDYAFSNNAKGLFGPASFLETAFQINQGQLEHVIRLN